MSPLVALITGAGAGIGRAVALAFARSGCVVAAADISGRAADETCEMITKAGGPEPLAIQCDVSKEDEVQRMLDRITGG